MSIIEAIKCTETGMRRPSRLRVSVVCDDSGKAPSPSTHGMETEYVLFAKVYVTFFASDKTFLEARERAERSLLAQMHSGILSKIVELRAIASQEMDADILRLCDEMQREVGL